MPDDIFHLVYKHGPNLFAGFGRAFGLLANESDLTVDDIRKFQFHHIGNIDPVAEIEEQCELRVKRAWLSIKKVLKK